MSQTEREYCRYCGDKIPDSVGNLWNDCCSEGCQLMRINENEHL